MIAEMEALKKGNSHLRKGRLFEEEYSLFKGE